MIKTLFTMFLCFGSHPDTHIGHGTSDIRHGTLDIGHRTWDIGHGTSDMGHQTWDIGHGTSDMGHRAWDMYVPVTYYGSRLLEHFHWDAL